MFACSCRQSELYPPECELWKPKSVWQCTCGTLPYDPLAAVFTKSGRRSAGHTAFSGSAFLLSFLCVCSLQPPYLFASYSVHSQLHSPNCTRCKYANPGLYCSFVSFCPPLGTRSACWQNGQPLLVLNSEALLVGMCRLAALFMLPLETLSLSFDAGEKLPLPYSSITFFVPPNIHEECLEEGVNKLSFFNINSLPQLSCCF